MKHPPRLAHLATAKVLAAKLVPVYARTHDVEDDEARERLERALSGSLRDELLDATWETLRGKAKAEDGELLDKVATSLKDRPMRPGRAPDVNPAWGAFLLLTDLEAGTAGEAARRVFESPQGRQKAAQGLAEAGRYLASELTRK